MNKEGFKVSKESIEKFFPKEDIPIHGYESPIQTYIGQMRIEVEDGIFKAVREYVADVNEEELIKALSYDREQYEKGYCAGYNAGFNANKWIPITSDEKPRHLRDYFIAYVFDDSDRHFYGEAKYHAFGGNGLVDRPHFSNEGVDGMRVTHWMPIPKLPKEEEDDNT